MSNYLSVTEYAKLHNKDVGNVRRLLASKRLKGQKVGNQWIIAEDTAYPKDRRQKDGRYHNLRKRLVLNKNKNLMNTINSMTESLKAIYGDLLSQVIIYGSYARGTQTDDSDVDIALIVSKRPSKKMTNKMINCVSSYELNSGKVLSVIDIDYDKYREWKNILPFYKNIDKEGIILWQS